VGFGVSYNPPGSDWSQHEPKASDLQFHAVMDAAGRRGIDCDGFAALAASLVRGIDGGRYEFNYGYLHGTNGTHMVGAVYDKKTGAGFVTDNETTDITFQRKAGEDPLIAARRGVIAAMSRHFVGEAILDKIFSVAPTFAEAIHARPAKKVA
jgi:hypothetical protein